MRRHRLRRRRARLDRRPFASRDMRDDGDGATTARERIARVASHVDPTSRDARVRAMRLDVDARAREAMASRPSMRPSGSSSIRRGSTPLPRARSTNSSFTRAMPREGRSRTDLALALITRATATATTKTVGPSSHQLRPQSRPFRLPRARGRRDSREKNRDSHLRGVTSRRGRADGVSGGIGDARRARRAGSARPRRALDRSTLRRMTPPRLRAHVYEYHHASIAFIAFIASPRAPVIQIKSNQRARAFFLCPKEKEPFRFSHLSRPVRKPRRGLPRVRRALRAVEIIFVARGRARRRAGTRRRANGREGAGRHPGGAARRCRRARGRGGMRALDEEEGARTASRG